MLSAAGVADSWGLIGEGRDAAADEAGVRSLGWTSIHETGAGLGNFRRSRSDGSVEREDRAADVRNLAPGPPQRRVGFLM